MTLPIWNNLNDITIIATAKILALFKAISGVWFTTSAIWVNMTASNRMIDIMSNMFLLILKI